MFTSFQPIALILVSFKMELSALQRGVHNSILTTWDLSPRIDTTEYGYVKKDLSVKRCVWKLNLICAIIQEKISTNFSLNFLNISFQNCSIVLKPNSLLSSQNFIRCEKKI